MWVAPFGHPRITAPLQLPWAFRSLARPSSPLIAEPFPNHVMYLTFKCLVYFAVLQQNNITPVHACSTMMDLSKRKHRIPGWWRRRKSNSRPPACKAGALPIELRPQNMVGLDGLEPSTLRLSGVRSNHLSYKPLPRWSRSPPKGVSDWQCHAHSWICILCDAVQSGVFKDLPWQINSRVVAGVCI